MFLPFYEGVAPTAPPVEGATLAPVIAAREPVSLKE